MFSRAFCRNLEESQTPPVASWVHDDSTQSSGCMGENEARF